VWAEAVAAAQRAAELAKGGEVGVELQQRVADLNAQLAQEAHEVERDRLALDRLAEIRIKRAEVRTDGFDFGSAVPAYAQALRDYGLDVESLEPETAGAEIKKRSIRQALVAAIDEWAWIKSKADTNDTSWHRLSAVARAADPDPWRNRLRDAL